MPKKPFSAEEVAYQRERIMDGAATVMAEQGFHGLSMRKLAGELGMTASNIYNYFPSKESLLLTIRRHGFESLFRDTNLDLMDSRSPRDALHRLSRKVLAFARDRAGYFQLMFQAPRINVQELDAEERQKWMQLERLLEEWQLHVQRILVDAVEGLSAQPDQEQRRVTLFYLAALHGLIGCCHHQSLPGLLSGVELIAEDLVETHTNWLVQAVSRQSSVKV